MVHQITYTSNEIPQLCDRVHNDYLSKRESDSQPRYLISLAGVPGSGKTTFANAIAKRLSTFAKVVVLSQDGFHLYRSELTLMADPKEAFRRRGAPFTFNAQAFVNLISKLKDRSQTIKAPSFDHKLKDPIEDDIVIHGDVDIIIIEGNYVSLRDKYWDEIENFVDDTWFIKTPENLVRERIIKRHLNAGIAANEKEAAERADGSDMQNAHYIDGNSKPTKVLILSE